MKLSAPAADVWVATAAADAGGHASAYLVPLSLAWLDGGRAGHRGGLDHGQEHHQRQTRLAAPTRHVVMIDADLEPVSQGLDEVPADLARGYAMQADWDPREVGRPDAVPGVAPQRIQAWREANELAGRTLMRAGEWIT